MNEIEIDLSTMRVELLFALARLTVGQTHRNGRSLSSFVRSIGLSFPKCCYLLGEVEKAVSIKLRILRLYLPAKKEGLLE